jgi:uncharacterized protein (DUF488 family)
MRIYTIGHGARPAEELIDTLQGGEVATLVDVRRFPSSRRHPQFDRVALEEVVTAAGIEYVHTVELGGRRSGEPGEERFGCVRVAAFRAYAARMGTREWQEALEETLARPAPCFMCAETLWWRCHRRFIAELLAARGYEIVHLMRPHEIQRHRPLEEAEYRDGRLYLCGELVA